MQVGFRIYNDDDYGDDDYDDDDDDKGDSLKSDSSSVYVKFQKKNCQYFPSEYWRCLSDPSLIIGYDCHSLTHPLTD